METIADLVEKLLKMPQDLRPIFAKDPEGNSFLSLDDLDVYYVEKPGPGSVESEIEEVFTDEDLEDEDSDVINYAFEKVVVIFPK